ncbi:MAG: diaminopimelate epimerase [Haliscomenobacter sp.]|nr:diaminopimelate epimerase [Haliscomenobacter sp.]
MKIPFFKYQGAGNDFVMVDQRDQAYLERRDRERIAWLCDRRFGIGGDGLILLQHVAGYDFEMLYFNADGGEGSLCGNGGRCVAAFAHYLNQVGSSCIFLASDGPHEARLTNPAWVELKMRDVEKIEDGLGYACLNTGSPHYVRFVSSLSSMDVFQEGRRVRYAPEYAAEGINVNFVEIRDGELEVATYERGVENETLACGTGVTAAAMAHVRRLPQAIGYWDLPIRTKGGPLRVRFEYDGNAFREVWLCGPAVQVFSGTIFLD